MAKKTNRSKSKPAAKPATRQAVAENAAPPTEQAVSDGPVAPSPAPVTPRSLRPVRQSRSQVASEQLEEQYAYITTDLRRVFILAAVMFALLIALNIAFDLMAR